MAEPPQERSIARREDTGGPPAPARGLRALLAWLKLDGEPSEMAPALRVLLTFVKEVGVKQIEQVPGLGPLISALLQLSAEEDSIELDSQLAEILETGRQSRETLDALGALATAIYLEQRALREHLESEGLSVRPEQITAVSLSTALAAYRGRVARDYQYADHRGIEGGTRAEHAASLPLDEVYVLPRLVPERARIESRDRESRILRDLLDNEDLLPEERAQLEEEFAILTGERWKALAEGEEGIPAEKAIEQARHLVIIGSPGVGKSALTRFLARTCALGAETMRERLGWAEEDLIPIPLSLAAYADARSRRSGLSIREYLDSRLQDWGGDALREAVAAALRQGRALVLFDGVDEIPESRERILIVRAVEDFLASHSAARFIITSRSYGYVRLAGEIPHFQLPNFSGDQVGVFVHRWQRAFERRRHSDAADLLRANQEAENMLKEIRRNPRVEELATNPLMLVILALLRHEHARLPEERVQLYNRAINTLMDSWNRCRCLANIDVGGVHLPLDRLVRVWSAVAEWTRRAKPTGVVYRAELKKKLIDILCEEELDDEGPEATAASYLNAAADRAGLLEERGKDIFAFWHPTFEEFLAAVELTTPSSRAIARILPLRGDPRWREVILLSVGYLGVVQRDRESATELVRAIWSESPGPLESLLHSHLRLAAACVADDVGVKRSLVESILVALAKMISDFPYEPLVLPFISTVRGLQRLRPSPDLVSSLGPLLRHGSREVRAEIARLLRNVAGENQEADHLLAQAHSCEDRYFVIPFDLPVRRGFSGVRFGDWSRLFTDKKIETLLGSSDLRTRVATFHVMDWLGESSHQHLWRLDPCLRAPEADLRIDAASILLGMEPGKALEFLVHPLSDKPWVTMAACQKVIDREPLAEIEARRLGEIVRFHPSDSEEKSASRALLFYWLYARLELQGHV